MKSYATGKRRRRARGRRSRPRICLRKGCRRKYHPRCHNQRYCQDPECLRGAERRPCRIVQNRVQHKHPRLPLDDEALECVEVRAVRCVRHTDQPRALRRESAEHLEPGLIADEHYDQISALIKSVRGSDPDAGLYWMARMIEAGEDPRFLARRIVILASEDVGNADPRAIQVAAAAFDIVEKIGMPEAQLTLAQAAIYMATAPKSNACTLAISSAKRSALRNVRSGRSTRTHCTQLTVLL